MRLYPTSAPASTVGGWLARGGAGIGSHAYGRFVDNVLAARIVTGTGEVREVAGAEDAGHMVVDGLLADHQLLSDLAVPPPVRDQAHHLRLARRQFIIETARGRRTVRFRCTGQIP